MICLAILPLFMSVDSKADDKEAVKQAEKSNLEIEADEGVTCSKQEQTCTAKTNVKVTKGPFTLFCDNLVAHIKKNDVGKMAMWRVVANGSVRILGADTNEKAFAPVAEYNLDTAKVMLNAIGNDIPVVVKDDYVVKAGEIEVLLHKDDGKKSIKKMQARNNVILSSPDEISFSDHADYDPEVELATLNGNVKIYRKEGKLTGSQAKVDLATQTSIITDNLKDQSCEPKRVHALIIPKNIDKTEKMRLLNEK